jgi:transcriptional regulator with XRE-family HTH domain
MAKTFKEYSDKRETRLSSEGQAAARVFDRAYTVAAAVLEVRQQSGLTQAQVAAMSGIDQSDISRIERGRMIPETATLAKLASALGGSLELRFGEQAHVIAMPEPETTPPATARRTTSVQRGVPSLGLAAFHTGPPRLPGQ